jgi:2'-5' RNA ligase
MKIAIFIEPDYKLNSKILYWKNIIKKKLGNQIYLNHPPHLTLFTLEIKKKLSNKHLSEIKKLIAQHNKFDIAIKTNSVFYEDPITKGQTLYYSLKNSVKLKILQKKLLILLANFNLNKINKNNLKGIMKRNYIKYGYPFFGKNWIPHFTIASVKIDEKNEMIKSFISKKINVRFVVKKISLWRIRNDKHLKLKSFDLL